MKESRYLIRDAVQDWEIWDMEYRFEDARHDVDMPIATFAKERFTLAQVRRNLKWIQMISAHPGSRNTPRV